MSSCSSAISIFSDSQRATRPAGNEVINRRYKQIDVSYLFVCDGVSREQVHPEYISTSETVADILTNR